MSLDYSCCLCSRLSSMKLFGSYEQDVHQTRLYYINYIPYKESWPWYYILNILAALILILSVCPTQYWRGPAGQSHPKGKGFAPSHPLPPDAAASQQQQSSGQQLGKEGRKQSMLGWLTHGRTRLRMSAESRRRNWVPTRRGRGRRGPKRGLWRGRVGLCLWEKNNSCHTQYKHTCTQKLRPHVFISLKWLFVKALGQSD